MIAAISALLIALSLVTTPLTYPPAPLSEVDRLSIDVHTLPYETTDIRYNKFDCSDTSAIAQNELSKKGWDARIIVLTRSDKRNHAMVRVYGSKVYNIECTRKALVSALPTGYSGVYEYADVVDAVQHSGYGTQEWGFDVYIEQMERKGERQ